MPIPPSPSPLWALKSPEKMAQGSTDFPSADSGRHSTACYLYHRAEEITRRSPGSTTTPRGAQNKCLLDRGHPGAGVVVARKRTRLLEMSTVVVVVLTPDRNRSIHTMLGRPSCATPLPSSRALRCQTCHHLSRSSTPTSSALLETKPICASGRMLCRQTAPTARSSETETLVRGSRQSPSPCRTCLFGDAVLSGRFSIWQHPPIHPSAHPSMSAARR